MKIKSTLKYLFILTISIFMIITLSTVSKAFSLNITTNEKI